MERCISTNNILRRKLEELLLPHNVSFQGDSSNNVNRSQHNMSNQSHANTSNPIDGSIKSRSILLSHAETSALTKELERLEAEEDQQVDSGKVPFFFKSTSLSCSEQIKVGVIL